MAGTEPEPVSCREVEPAKAFACSDGRVVLADPVGVEVDAHACCEDRHGEIHVVAVELIVGLVAAQRLPKISADEVAAAHDGPMVGRCGQTMGKGPFVRAGLRMDRLESDCAEIGSFGQQGKRLGQSVGIRTGIVVEDEDGLSAGVLHAEVESFDGGVGFQGNEFDGQWRVVVCVGGVVFVDEGVDHGG